MYGLIRDTLAPHGVEHFGVCRYGDCLPLLPVGAAARLPPGARSVVVCLFPYHDRREYKSRNVARYAVLRDYHRVAGDILATLAASLAEGFPGERFVPFVDSSPIREVAAAQLAGLGAVVFHGQLIHREYGCKVFLGEVVTTLSLPPSPPEAGRCFGCGRCVAACPTGALSPAGLDTHRCRSAISQKKGALSPWEQEQLRLGGLAWGCDLCTDACPMNTGRATPIPGLLENPLPLLTEQNLAAALRDKPYGYRGRAVLLRNLSLLDQRPQGHCPGN